jgi:hypothetical protein
MRHACQCVECETDVVRAVLRGAPLSRACSIQWAALGRGGGGCVCLLGHRSRQPWAVAALYGTRSRPAAAHPTAHGQAHGFVVNEPPDFRRTWCVVRHDCTTLSPLGRAHPWCARCAETARQGRLVRFAKRCDRWQLAGWMLA